MYVLTIPLTGCFPVSFPLASLFLKPYSIEIRTVNNSTMASKYSYERKSQLVRQLHYCPVLINCHSHSNLQQLPSWSVSSHQHGGKTLYRQKYYDFLKAQLMVSIFNNKVFLKLRYARNLHTVLYSGCTRTGNRTALAPSSPTAGQTHWANQNWKRHMYPSVHCSTVYNSQDMETT